MAQSTQYQLMTVADVIAAMGISRSTWQKLVAQKRTPPIVRIGAVQRIILPNDFGKICEGSWAEVEAGGDGITGPRTRQKAIGRLMCDG